MKPKIETRLIREARVLVPKELEWVGEDLAYSSWEGETQELQNSMTVCPENLQDFILEIREFIKDKDESHDYKKLLKFLLAVVKIPADRYIFMAESSPRKDIWPDDQKRAQIVVGMQGGCIDDIFTNHPALVGLDVDFIEEDDEVCDPEALVEVGDTGNYIYTASSVERLAKQSEIDEVNEAVKAYGDALSENQAPNS